MAHEMWLSWLEYGNASVTVNTWAIHTTGRGAVPVDLRNECQPMATTSLTHIFTWFADRDGTITSPA